MKFCKKKGIFYFHYFFFLESTYFEQFPLKISEKPILRFFFAKKKRIFPYKNNIKFTLLLKGVNIYLLFFPKKGQNYNNFLSKPERIPLKFFFLQ